MTSCTNESWIKAPDIAIWRFAAVMTTRTTNVAVSYVRWLLTALL